MGEADHTPAEEGEQGSQVREPAEDVGTALAHIQVREATAQDEGRDQTVPGAAGLVGLEELLGRHAEGGQPHGSARAAVARDGARGHDRDQDDGVHHVGEGLDAAVAVGDDEGRGVGARAAEEVRVVRADVDGDHEGADEVEEREAQPDGPDGAGHRLLGVGGLGGHQAAVLGPRHGEDARRHDGQEAAEAVGEGHLAPVPEPDGLVAAPAGREHDHGDDDDEDPPELDGRADDLDLAEERHGAHVDQDDHGPPNGDPSRDRHRRRPEADHRVGG